MLPVAGLWTVMTLGLANQRAVQSGAESSEPLLANQSVLLLLVLTNHCCVDGVRNPFRDAFFSCVGTDCGCDSCRLIYHRCRLCLH